tara:strand:+ start:1197 stop:3116 length:1920 start_codon:yes stop_codon:yes gene_type:complete
MKKLNETQMSIFEEESARALLLKEAKKDLDDVQYQGLLTVLPKYEIRADQKGIPRIELYEGFFGQIKKIGSRLGDSIEMMAANKQGKAEILVQKYSEVAKEIDKIAVLGQRPDSAKLFSDEAARLPALKAQASELLSDINKLNPNTAAELKAASEAAIRDNQRKMDADSLKYAADKLGLKPEDLFRIDLTLAGSPGAKGNPSGGDSASGDGSNSDRESRLQLVYNRFRQKVDLDGDGTVSDSEKVKADKDGDGDMDAKDVLALLISLGVKDKDILSQIIKKLGMDPEDVEGDDAGGEGGDTAQQKNNKVAKLQDQVILALNKVLDAKNVDMSRKDTMELAKTLTNNIVDQLRVNGVKFKGLDESVYNTVYNRLLLEQEEQEQQEEENEEQPLPSKLERLLKLRVKRLARNDNNFLKLLIKVRREFADKGYGKKDVFKGYINTEVEQEFVGLYDAYLDIMALGKFEKILKKKVKAGDNNAAQVLSKSKDKLLAVAGKKVKVRQLSSLIVHFANFYKISNDRNRPPTHPSEVEKYLKFKKKGAREEKGGADAKDMYKPEKVADAKLPQGKKGQVNVKNLIFQSLKGLQMDSEQVQDIERSLNKKLQSIVKQYIAKGMDVSVLEEKITKYANAAVKHLNENK